MANTHLLKLNINDVNFSIIKNIRKIVFTDEIGISNSELFDQYDEICDHFIIFDGKNIAGSVRSTTIGKIIKLERMAILKEYRLKNHGKTCILQLKEYYNALGYTQIILDSIYSVSNFYKKCGFSEKGKIFRRVEIDHIGMFLDL